MKEPTQERLKELFNYDAKMGTFTRIITKHYNAKKGDIAGSKGRRGYLKIAVDGKQYYAHRLAWIYMQGAIPENSIVDHKNRNTSDNSWEDNIRLASRRGNFCNSKLSKRNTSGVMGVYWKKERKKWRAYITNNGKNISLGSFSEKIDAVKARWDAENKYGWSVWNPISTAYLYLKNFNLGGTQ